MHIVLKKSSFLYSHNFYTDSTYVIMLYLPGCKTSLTDRFQHEPLSKALTALVLCVLIQICKYGLYNKPHPNKNW